MLTCGQILAQLDIAADAQEAPAGERCAGACPELDEACPELVKGGLSDLRHGVPCKYRALTILAASPAALPLSASRSSVAGWIGHGGA